MKLITILLTSSLLIAGEALTENDYLQAGRRMISIEVQGHTLSGKAPAGRGAPFRIQDGSQVLWQGAAGETFTVTPGTEDSRLYLVCENARNTQWQELAWQGKRHTPSPSGKSTTLKAADHGVVPSTADSGPALRQLFDTARKQARETGSCIISLEKGEYHFYPQGSLGMSYYISNHDQEDTKQVGIPLVDMENVTLDGNGATFVFHGRMQPILIMDSEHITCRDINIRYATPFALEAKITKIEGSKVEVDIAQEFSWFVRDKQLFIGGEVGNMRVSCALAFENDGRMVPSGRRGDLPISATFEQVGINSVRFDMATQDVAALHPGVTLVLRSYARPNPAMLLYRAEDTVLERVVFHDSQGMGLIAQRSRDITIKGGGCIRAQGRMHTTEADATHFSNCSGLIKVKGALYEGMMDDAINVHSTCLRIDSVISPREIVARYMHRQAVGFEVFQPGETTLFIKGPTLEEHKDKVRVAKVHKIDESHLKIIFDKDLPEGIGVGDAIENADWYPEVRFTDSIVRHNRARGALFTTPLPVLVQGCHFDHSHGSAILLAGDAQGWYESGACRNVKIINNIFDHNLTAHYQFCEAIISICPEIKQPGKQRERYHRNITIRGNTFLSHRVPLLYAISADGIKFINNNIIWDNRYPGTNKGKQILRYSEHLDWRENKERERK